MAEPATSSPHKHTQSTATGRRQSRLLQTCAITLLTMAQKAFRTAEELRWPVGASARMVAQVAGPLVYIIQCQWLAILSFVDDQISTVENVAEFLLPQLALLFDKIESLVDATESLPRNIDHVLVELETTIRKAAALNPLTNKAINVLDHLIWTLIDPGCREAKEKDIAVDERSSRASRNDEAMAETGTEEAQLETTESEIHIKEVSHEAVGVSDKEGEKNEENKGDQKKAAKTRDAEIIVQADEENTKDIKKKESIVELFEAGWGL